MVLLRLDSLALSRSRFALSPFAETLGSVIVLSRPCTDPWLAAWHSRHHAAFRARLDADPFARGLVMLVGSTKYLPDHVTLPPSGGMTTTLESELVSVAAVPDDAVRSSLEQTLAHSWEEHDLDWLTGRDFAARTADLFRAVWHEHLAAEWPTRRALLERDVTYRAGLLAAYGWPRALHRMSRRSAWVGADAIRFSDRPGPDRVIGPDGMLFIPVTAPRGTWLCEAPGAPYGLVYPARGVGDLAAAETGEAGTAGSTGGRAGGAAGAERGRGGGGRGGGGGGGGGVSGGAQPESARTGAGHALSKLLGPGRATILRELERPATSSELAALLNLSLGTVGGHLAILRDAELVSRTRVGRRVVYRRTELGDLLSATGRDGVGRGG